MTYSQRHVVLLLFLVVFAAVHVPALSDTDPGDAAAMRALATSTGADRSLGWTAASDPCTSWAGVRCDSDGRVTAVQAGNKSLSGKLPAELANLTALTVLELPNNRLSGPLPRLPGLSQLQLVLLQDNAFDSIPADFFAGLTGLTAVYLDDNPLAPWPVPDSLTAAAGLVNFSATNTNITGGVPAIFATAFPSIYHVALSYNLLEGEIPAAFAGSSLRSLWLNNQRTAARLTGGLAIVANMTSLVQLWLNSNGFSGPIPDLSPLAGLEDLQLRDNQLTGPVPASLARLPALKKLSLTNNLLQGPPPAFPKTVTADLVVASERFCVPAPGDCDPRVNTLIAALESLDYPAKFAQSWTGNNPCDSWLGVGCDIDGNVTVINFQKLGLNGSISPEFAKITSLQKLLLADNNLSGTIPPQLADLASLTVVDVSNNQLSGQVPKFSKNVAVSTQGNPNIGKDIVVSPPGSSPSGPSGSHGSGSNPSSPGDGGDVAQKKSNSSSVGVIAGSVIGGVCAVFLVGLLGICYCRRQRQPLGRVQSPNTTVIHPRHSGSDPGLVKITVASSSTNGTAAVNETYSPSSSRSDVHMVEAGNMVISIQVLRNVTDNFSEVNILGRGGFGTVYKGELHDGTKIAVKRMEAAGVMGTKGLNEFKAEIAVLTKVRHRHLVSLLGYCLDGNERLLVYEYMPQGTLSKHLFDWKEEGLEPLEWKKRLSIALDVARGVEYLHTLAHQSFIHRDLKPSNILLGDDMKAKVADFGLVRLAPDGKGCSVETRLAGTFGYLAPEYAVTGRVTTKADVFSFGVILMELITGRKALDENQPEESMHLVTWFRRMQLNKDTFRKAIDPTIDLDEETFASISTVSELAGHCCTREPHQRPDMGHAVNVLSSLAELWQPTDPDLEDNFGIDLDMTLPQALKKWQAFEDSQMDGTTSSFHASLDNTQTSIPTRPPGFAESFTSADGR